MEIMLTPQLNTFDVHRCRAIVDQWCCYHHEQRVLRRTKSIPVLCVQTGLRRVVSACSYENAKLNKV